MDFLETLTDRYVTCEQGHEHWGAAGAAGLLVRSINDAGEDVFLLQHRSPEVHMGDCWGIPGGALDNDETALDGAIREAAEEMMYFPSPDSLTLLRTEIVDHGGWAYTTLVVSAPYFTPEGSGWETGSEGFGWFSLEAMALLDLHPGFASALHNLIR